MGNENTNVEGNKQENGSDVAGSVLSALLDNDLHKKSCACSSCQNACKINPGWFLPGEAEKAAAGCIPSTGVTGYFGFGGLMTKIADFISYLNVPLLLVLILFIVLLFTAATAISHCMLAAKLEKIERILSGR